MNKKMNLTNPVLPSKNWGTLSNTPPLDTWKNENRGMIVGLFDWFTLTFDNINYYLSSFVMDFDSEKRIRDLSTTFIDQVSEEIINELLVVLGSDKEFENYELEKGTRDYRYSICINEGIKLFLKGPECSSGYFSTKLEITGLGCRQIDKLNKGWYNLFNFALQNGARYTRFDTALDDKSGKNFTIYDLMYHVERGWFTSVWKGKPLRTSTDYLDSSGNRIFEGLTYQLGRKSSNVLLRVYDKNAERSENEYNFIPDSDYYIRWELQINDHNRISEIMKKYIYFNDCGNVVLMTDFILGIINEFIVIRDYATDTNKSRWPINLKWQRFIESKYEIKTFASDKVKGGFDSSLHFIETSASKALAKIYLTFGEATFKAFIEKNLLLGLRRISENDIHEINNKLHDLDISKTVSRKAIKMLMRQLELKENELNATLRNYIPIKKHNPNIIKNETVEKAKRFFQSHEVEEE